MEPLWNFGNFAYRWSFVEKMNTAVLSINKKKDMTIIDLYNRIVKKSRNLDDLISNFHPDEVSKEIVILNVLKNNVFEYKPLKILNQFNFPSNELSKFDWFPLANRVSGLARDLNFLLKKEKPNHRLWCFYRIGRNVIIRRNENFRPSTQHRIHFALHFTFNHFICM